VLRTPLKTFIELWYCHTISTYYLKQPRSLHSTIWIYNRIVQLYTSNVLPQETHTRSLAHLLLSSRSNSFIPLRLRIPLSRGGNRNQSPKWYRLFSTRYIDTQTQYIRNRRENREGTEGKSNRGSPHPFFSPFSSQTDEGDAVHFRCEGSREGSRKGVVSLKEVGKSRNISKKTENDA